MATPADATIMAELERGDPNSANWPHKHYEALYRATVPERVGYVILVAEDASAADSPASSALPRPIVGYVAAHRVDSEWELQYLVVAKELQGRGIATYLVNKFVDLVRANGGSCIRLEVRESNKSARALYRKLGFEEAGLRKGYYANPPDDAILCRLSL